METSSQTILVTGATGHQGGAVAHSLLKRGKSTVLALVRDKNTPAAQALQQAGASLAEGNLNDRVSLDRAVEGVHGVFSVQGLQDGMEAEIRQGKALADAAKAAGIQHFVYSSVGSAERHTGIPHFDSKFQIEEHIRAIDLPHTILRPVFFYYNYVGMRPLIEEGIFMLPLSPNRKLQQLSENDYGEMAAEVFAHRDEFLSRAIEAASVDMTMTEVADTFSRAFKNSVTYRQIPYETFEQQVGKEITTMFRWFEDVGYNADLAALKREFGEPTSLEACIHAYLTASGQDQLKTSPRS